MKTASCRVKLVGMVALTDGSGNRNGGLVTKMIPANKIKAEMFLMQVNLCPKKMAANIMVKSGLVNIKVMASPTCKTLISSRTLDFRSTYWHEFQASKRSQSCH